MAALYAREACRHVARLVGQGGSGRVHSVFRRAVNLWVDQRMLCLLSAGRAPHPYSVVLASVEDLRTVGLAPDAPVTLSAGRIAIAGEGGLVEVFLEDAALCDLEIRRLRDLRILRDPDARLDALALAAVQSPDAQMGLAPMMGRWAPARFPALPTNHHSDFLLPRMYALPETLRRGDADAIGQAGRALAGCGPGLTPSSDDLLAGLAAALWAADLAGLWPKGRDAARALAQGAAAATGTLSACALRSAAQGLFSRDILGLLAVWFSPAPPEALADAARAVAAFGATSGVDTLCGLWLGLGLAHHTITFEPVPT